MKKLKLVNISNLNLFNHYLTILKIYDGVSETAFHYLINDDRNNEFAYFKWRFKDVTRELKIKKLL